MSIVWLLASILILFALENIWVAPWLKSHLRGFPNLVPEPLGRVWFLALFLVGLSCVFLIVAQILVVKDEGIALKKRIVAGLATLVALMLSLQWVRVTGGVSSAQAKGHESKHHSVTLTWTASKSAVKGYNVYRGTTSGGPYARINYGLVLGLGYKDQDVPSGKTYYYVTRAVDAKGLESPNSSEIKVTVP